MYTADNDIEIGTAFNKRHEEVQFLRTPPKRANRLQKSVSSFFMNNSNVAKVLPFLVSRFQKRLTYAVYSASNVIPTRLLQVVYWLYHKQDGLRVLPHLQFCLTLFQAHHTVCEPSQQS